jgi:HEAT repeat protein
MPMAGESTDRDLLRKLLRIARTEDDRRELAMDTLVRALVQHTAAHGNRARKRSARRLRDWGPDAVATLSDIAAGDDSNPSIPALRLLVDVDERAGIESAVDSARLATGSDLAEILAILSARGAAATGPLVEAFESPVTEGRHRLAIALGHLGGAAAPAVPVLANALDDPQEEVRAWSVFALARIGRPALEYLPRMEQVLAATPLEMAPQSFEALERLRATARDD